MQALAQTPVVGHVAGSLVPQATRPGEVVRHFDTYEFNEGLTMPDMTIRVTQESGHRVPITYYLLQGITQEACGGLVHLLVNGQQLHREYQHLIYTYYFNRHPECRAAFQSVGGAVLRSEVPPAGLVEYLMTRVKPGAIQGTPAVVGNGTEENPQTPAVVGHPGVLPVAAWGEADLTLPLYDERETDAVSGIVLHALVRLLGPGRESIIQGRRTATMRMLDITDVTGSIFADDVYATPASWTACADFSKRCVSARQSLLKSVLMETTKTANDSSRLMMANAQLLRREGTRNFERLIDFCLYGGWVIERDPILIMEASKFRRYWMAFLQLSLFDRVFGKAIMQGDLVLMDKREVNNLLGAAQMFANAANPGVRMIGTGSMAQNVHRNVVAALAERGLGTTIQT